MKNSGQTKTVRVMRGRRLAYYRAAADAAFWDAHWRQALTLTHYTGAMRGELGRYERLFTRWLPKPGRILEAGCGTGLIVAALRARGYEAQGVEWGEQTVATVNHILPDLPVAGGDVTCLDEPDEALAGYISLGVMEHREEGPEAFLHEAWRVLEPGGVALISVPNLHSLRALKARLGLYRGRIDGLPFYQYAYTADLFGELLQGAGFDVLTVEPYDGFKGIKDELPLARLPLRLLKRTRLTRPWIEHCRFGHMMMYVCRKRMDRA